MSKKKNKSKDIKIPQQAKPEPDPYSIIILTLTFLVPIFVTPYLLDNMYNIPKTLLIMIGAFLMIGLYGFRICIGKSIKYPKTTTPLWLILIVLLNFLSFFYTQNYYYTKVAVLMNINCLAIFYFTSLSVDAKKSIWILTTIALGGIIVSLIAVLQFFDSPMLIQWLKTGNKTIGTIGNSNYLGAYLLFPLISLTGLVFLLKGKRRFIPVGAIILVFVALLFARARASWLGFFIAFPTLLILIKSIHRFSISDFIKSHPRKIIGYATVAICIISLLWLAMPQRFYPEMKSRLNLSTLNQRMQFYDASWKLFKGSPIFGTGLWSYRNQFYRAQAEILKADPGYLKDNRANQPKRVHNEYLEVLNDGGLLAAAVLLVFLLTIMGHGLKVIRDSETDTRTRIVAATAFSAIIAIMVDAVFFFPFRINTTIFMTSLVLGMAEGIYLNRYQMIMKTEPCRFPFSYALAGLVLFVLLSLFWFMGYKPFMAEREHFEFKKMLAQNNFKEAESHILNAIKYDPGNTRHHIYAALMYTNNFHNHIRAGELIEESLVNFIGDNVLWGLYYTKGLIRFRMGSLIEARALFHKSLYFNPKYIYSIEKLDELEKIFAEHDKVCIKLK